MWILVIGLLHLYTLGFISKYYSLLTSYSEDMLLTPICVDLPTLYSYIIKAGLQVSGKVACLS